MAIRLFHKVYPPGTPNGHSAVSQGIPKGTPLWPFGCFTRYTQGHPIMAIRLFHKVYYHIYSNKAIQFEHTFLVLDSMHNSPQIFWQA